MTKRQQFITWLGDAHAMEVGIVTTLEKHIADAKGQPKVRAALTKHLRETKNHAKEMEKALAALGGSHPAIKEGVSKLGNILAGLVTSASPDTPVKNAIADFATEHFEIACYSLLVATAESLGETKIAAACKKILHEEQAMAKQLSELLVPINATYLSQLEDAPGAERKAAPVSSRPTKATATRSRAKSTRR